MSIRRLEKVLPEQKSKKCPFCETYERKIKEVEQTLAGRDSIISLFETQLKKCESNYKNLFNDFEKLRFEHCSAIQDNLSLKEINAKLEEFDLKSKSSLKNSSSQYDKSITGASDVQRIDEGSNTEIPEIKSIENLLNNQSETIKELVEGIIQELKVCRSDNSDKSGSLVKIDDEHKNAESGDHLDKDPKIQELQNQVETLKTLLDKFKEENKNLKQLLDDKKTSLCECQNILQDSSKSLNTISSSLDSIVKDNCLQKKEVCGQKKDKKVMVSSMDEHFYKTKLAQVESEMKEKEKQYETCRCTMMMEITDMSDNNQILSDTLEVIKEENKSNLETVAKLKEELKRVNEESETNQSNMTRKIAELENELEESKMKEEYLRKSLESSDKNLKERVSSVLEDNSTLKVCRCSREFELETALAELEGMCDDMRRDLTEKTLELSEYEEENMALSQQKEAIQKRNIDLQQKIDELEQELYEKTKEVRKSQIGTQVSADFDNMDLKKELSQIKEDNQCLADDCNRAKNDINKKLVEIECLKNSIRIQMSEIEKLNKDNEDLTSQLERQKSECRKETERLQSLVNQSQRQVEILLKEHDEKTAQIQGVATELDSIRKSVSEENNNFLSKIKQLEEEKEELQKQLDNYNREPREDCKCENGLLEIERLKSELIKKQCVILELERTMDNFNLTMRQFDQNLEELSSENASLKDEKDQRTRDLERTQRILNEKIKEIEEIQKQLENLEFNSEQCTTDTSLLKTENEMLKSQIEKLMLDKERSDRSLKTSNLELQMEIENLKQEHFRRGSVLSRKLENAQKTNDELKNQCAKKCFENEKLSEDLQNCKRLIEDLRNKCHCLQSENDKLKEKHQQSMEEQYQIKEELNKQAELCEKMKRDCTLKCVDYEDVNQKLMEQRREASRRSTECEALRKSLSDNERELFDTSEKYNELQKNYDQKCQELRKLKKQWESCCKQSQISRDEYNNLRKEYKEIKSMLSDQIKRYKRDTGSIEANQTSQNSEKSCKIVAELKKQLQERETQMVALEQKLKDASYEIIELKDYIHKLISDNNILKSAINNLIGNLERKIKGPSFGSLPSNSADVIAGEILQSLTDIENTIVRKIGCRGGCPSSCHHPSPNDCTCMLEIESKYQTKDCCSDCCLRRKHNPADTDLPNKSLSHPSTKIGSESTTTDSEDCRCPNFLDQRSVEFLRDAIKELKTKKDSTMKEKSCDCEPYSGNTCRNRTSQS